MNTRLITALVAGTLALATMQARAADTERLDTHDCGTPEYKRDWAIDEESGQVLLSFQVGDNGKVKTIKVVESSGFPSLDSASVRALKRCVFKNATAASKSQNWETVRYTWVLKEAT